MTRSMKVSGFLVASVPFTLTEYFTSPITSLHPLVFPDEYRDLRGELDVFSRIASGFRSLADSFQLGLAASSADVTRRLANIPPDVGPSFSSSRRWSGRRCRPWRSGWWRRLRYYSGSLNRCSDDCRKILERFLRSSDMFLRTSWNTLINLRVKFWQTWYGNLLKDGFQTLIKFFKLLLLYNFRLTFSTRSESSLAPMAPFFAFVYKHRELVKTGSQYVFFHDAPTLVRASSVRSRSRFYFIPSVTPCSAYTGDRQAWDSCSCTVPPFLSALSRTNYFWYSLSQSETD